MYLYFPITPITPYTWSKCAVEFKYNCVHSHRMIAVNGLLCILVEDL